LPHGIDAALLLERAVPAGVAFVPGAAFFYDGRRRNALRLSFSLASEDEIEDGVSRIAHLIRS
jgi:DNA-binding transcriptional MocR family regulator